MADRLRTLASNLFPRHDQVDQTLYDGCLEHLITTATSLRSVDLQSLNDEGVLRVFRLVHAHFGQNQEGHPAMNTYTALLLRPSS